jgi:hypothetical protein
MTVAITTIPVNRKAAATWAANSRVCLIMPHRYHAMWSSQAVRLQNVTDCGILFG